MIIVCNIYYYISKCIIIQAILHIDSLGTVQQDTRDGLLYIEVM